MNIQKKLSGILYRYQEKISLSYGVLLSRFYLIEGEVVSLFKNELRECYKDSKELNGEYSEKEFEAWYNYKYKQ